MVDYKLHYSNGFTYKPKYDEYPEEYWVSTLHFDQKCKITNYDPATSNGRKKGYITIDIGNNGTIIKNGEGDKLSENKAIADFSEKKFSIFHDIAALDDNGDRDKLTMEDLEKLDESYKTSWGLKDLVVDIEKGIATLVWGVGDILRIDFETDEEKLNKQSTTNEENVKEENVKKENKVNPSEKQITKVIKSVTTSVVNPSTITSQNTDEVDLNNTEKGDSTAFLTALGHQESGGEKNPYFCKNRFGYIGRYQMGEQAMAEMGIYRKKANPKTKKVHYNNDWTGVFVKNKYGIENLWDYRTSPEKQDLLQVDYKKNEWQRIKKMGLDRYVGKTISGILITESGMLAGSHLVGVGGLRKFLLSNGENDVKDGTGTRISYYINKFSGYDVASFTQN